MKYIIEPQDFKTEEEYLKAMESAIRDCENKMLRLREKKLALDQSQTAFKYLEKLGYDATNKKLTPHGQKLYEDAYNEYMEKYNDISTEYDSVLHEWRKLKIQMKINTINFTGE